MNVFNAHDVTTLILVRHGETAWNHEHRFQGQANPPLNALGIQQAHALARRLRTIPIDIAFASDLQRALETARIITAKRDVQLIATPMLRERRLGAWEGLTVQEASRMHPREIEAWKRDVLSPIPDGESYEQLQARLRELLKQLLREYKGKSILIVSHSGPIKVAICTMLGWSLQIIRRFYIANGSLSIVQSDGVRSICRMLNDVCHLIHQSAPTM